MNIKTLFVPSTKVELSMWNTPKGIYLIKVMRLILSE